MATLLSVAYSLTARAGGEPLSPCGESLAQRIPARPSTARDGGQFLRQVRGLTEDEREAAILEELLAGNVPAFLRTLRPVALRGPLATGATETVVVCVSPDYLAIGSDQSFVLIPVRLTTALTVAARFGFVLPTPKMVNAIYAEAVTHLRPQPLPASSAMRSSDYYGRHNELVREQRLALSAPLGLLTAGDKKDLVLTNRLWSNPARVAIYGWHEPDGHPIQPLSTWHGARYADYSHGARLVSDTAYLDGRPVPLLRLLQDPVYAGVLSDEGEIPRAADLIRTLRAPPTSVPATARAVAD